MSNSYRSHRRRKKSNAGKLGLAGAITGVLGIGAVAVGYVALKPDDKPKDPPGLTVQGNVAQDAGGKAGTAKTPKTGPALSFTTPDGFGYELGAARAGKDEKPLPRSTPGPAGTTYAFIDYVLTNSKQQPALLEFPADLFVPMVQVPAAERERCMPQPGVPESMCTLPNHSTVTGHLNGSKPPIIQDGDTLMPGGASYLVRVATDLPVLATLQQSDIKLYVWNARFTSDRKGVEVAFPS